MKSSPHDTVTTQYVHGSGLGGDVGSMIRSQSLTADTDNDGEADSIDNRAYFYNWRGDVIDLLDGDGNTVFSYRYDAFGSTVSCLAYSGAQATEMNEPDASNPFLFSSKRFGFDTQLSYFGARYYDASLGRFISRDPMRYIDGPNMFVYVKNNPLIYIDILGLDATLYIWFTHKGHVAIDSDGEYLSFHPRTQELRNAGKPGVFRDELQLDKDTYGEPMVIHIKGDTSATTNYITTVKANGAIYNEGTSNGISFNCVDISQNALGESDIYIPTAGMTPNNAFVFFAGALTYKLLKVSDTMLNYGVEQAPLNQKSKNYIQDKIQQHDNGRKEIFQNINQNGSHWFKKYMPGVFNLGKTIMNTTKAFAESMKLFGSKRDCPTAH